MVRVIFALIFSLSNAWAQMDSNCTQMANERGWVKSGVYNSKKINDDFKTTQAELVDQLKGWQQLGSQYSCLQTIAGITFRDGNMHIVDMKKFTDFRLNSSQITCGETLSAEIDDNRLINNRSPNPTDGTRIVHRTRDGVQFASGGAPSAKDLHRVEIFDLIRRNNEKGDIGFRNYCSHQYRMGSVMTDFSKARKAFETCNQARIARNETVLRSKTCEGFPGQHAKKLAELEAEMLKIQQTESKVKFQPLERVNQADLTIFDKFRDDLKALKLAREKAKEAVAKLTDDYKFTYQDKKLSTCGDDTEAYSDIFDKGINHCGGGIPGVQLTIDKVADSYSAIRDNHRNELIEELNLQAFGEAVKSSYNLALPEHRAEAEANPAVSCKKLLALAIDSMKELERSGNFCQGRYLDKFKSAVAEAKRGAGEHFLSIPGEEVLGEFNAHIDQLNLARDSFCAKATEAKACGEASEWKEKCSSDIEAIEAAVEKIGKQRWSQYLYSNKIGEKISLPVFTPKKTEHLCPKFKIGETAGLGGRTIDWKDELRAKRIELKDLTAARGEFMDSVKKQVGNNISFKAADRGSKSNKFGKWLCGSGMGMDEKNDLYALNALYRSHPHLAGRLMNGLSNDEKLAYKGVICDALRCHDKVESGNEAIYTAAQIGAIGLSFIPGVGNAAAFAISASVSTMGAYSNKFAEQYKRDLVSQGAATNGYGEYSLAINQELDRLRASASERAALEAAVTDIALSFGAMKGADLLKSVKDKLAKQLFKNVTLTGKQQQIMDEAAEYIIEEKEHALVEGDGATRHAEDRIARAVVMSKAAMSSTAAFVGLQETDEIRSWSVRELSN